MSGLFEGGAGDDFRKFTETQLQQNQQGQAVIGQTAGGAQGGANPGDAVGQRLLLQEMLPQLLGAPLRAGELDIQQAQMQAQAFQQLGQIAGLLAASRGGQGTAAVQASPEAGQRKIGPDAGMVEV